MVIVVIFIKKCQYIHNLLIEKIQYLEQWNGYLCHYINENSLRLIIYFLIKYKRINVDQEFALS